MISIPDHVARVLEKIAMLSDGDFKKTEEIIASLPASLDPDEIAGNDALSNDNIDVVRALVGLNVARFEANLPIDQFIQNVLRSLKRKKDLARDFNEENFKSRITSFLNIESLILSARAKDVQQEYEKLFLSARVFSDIRPIFDPSGSKPVGCVVVHNLKIAFGESSGQQKEVFFALNSADLKILKKIIERAEQKESSLQELIKKTDLKYFL